MPIDDAQLAVIQASRTARLLVLSGPGSGKTEVSARRIAALISFGLSASQVLVLSFSRSAVRTLTDRLSKMGGVPEHVLEELRHVAIRTFDSWTFRLLCRLGIEPKELLTHSHDHNVSSLVDILRSGDNVKLVELLKNVRHLVVDEMQDLAGVRGDLVIELLKLLAPVGNSEVGFTLLGDPAQSIYAFSVRNAKRESIHGQSTKHLLDSLREIYGKGLQELALDRNYRAGPELAVFLEKLRLILGRKGSGEEKLKAMAKVMSGIPAADFGLDSKLIEKGNLHSIAILARTNGEVLRIAQKILGNEVEGPGIRFQVGSGDVSGGPAWVAALLAPLRSSTLTETQFSAIYSRAAEQATEPLTDLDAPKLEVAWRQLLQGSGRNVNDQSLVVRDLSEHLSWPDSFPDDEGPGSAQLTISTIHQSKGREFDVVAVLERDPDQEFSNSDAEEEANVDFVALSRASKRVVSLPRDSIFPPPSMRDFGNGSRKRLFWWRNGWVNMEMGIRGDIAPESFADSALHGSEEAVVENYRFLAGSARTLIGHKVMLRKASVPGSDGKRARYEICLQDDRHPGRLLGAMSQSLVYDLLNVLHEHGLPKTIMNLRISAVVSVPVLSVADSSIAPIFATSGMCLGVGLFGTGDFQTSRARA